MIRFQFMEALVRVAEVKYYQSKLSTTYHYSLQKLFAEHNLDKVLANKDQYKTWRFNIYWTEENEEILLKYWTFLKQIY